jgi:hypothetical protein
MSTAKTEHSEMWFMRIRPEDGEDPWPDLLAYAGGPVFRPDLIMVKIERGGSWPLVTAEGYRLKKDGPLGRGRSSRVFRQASELPGWLARMIEDHRRQQGLGPGATGCGW